MTKRFQHSYENSIKILNRSMDIEDKMRDIQRHMMDTTQDHLRRQVNKLVYDLANAKGDSVYNICFNTIPDYEYSYESSPKGKMVVNVTLKPVKFDFHKGPSFKEKMRDDLRETYFKLDTIVGDLVKARLDNDDEAERMALFRMEGEMVGMMQMISYIINKCEYDDTGDV